jgi:hypothetical protein
MQNDSKKLLNGLKLRGLIAFAARCARRVFPVIVLRGHLVRQSDEAIAMAESFASGEPGEFIRARQVAKAIRDDSYATGGGPRFPLQSSWYAIHGAEQLAYAAVDGFSAISRSPASKPCCESAFKHAADAFEHARRVTEPYSYDLAENDSLFVDFKSKFPTEAKEVRWARHAWEKDLESLRKSHSGAITELGMAIDTSPRGSLGALWSPGEVPRWYEECLRKMRKPPRITVITGREFLREWGGLDPVRKDELDRFIEKWDRYRTHEIESVLTNQRSLLHGDGSMGSPASGPELSRQILVPRNSGEPFPNLICWYVQPGATGSDLELLTSSLRAARVVSRYHVRPAPALVLFAPGLPAQRKLHLVDQGAIVLPHSPNASIQAKDDDSLRMSLLDRLEEAYDGWETDAKGLWSYAGARVTWRGAPMAQSPIFESESAEKDVSKQTDQETKASHDDYRNLLKYLEAEQTEY